MRENEDCKTDSQTYSIYLGWLNSGGGLEEDVDKIVYNIVEQMITNSENLDCKSFTSAIQFFFYS